MPLCPTHVLGLALALVATSVEAQDRLPLGPRVGDTLDAQERAYFGLFPGLEAPPPYQFVAVGDSVHVTHADSTLLTLPRADADRLAVLTETFEDFSSVPDNPQWEASAAFVRYIDARVPVPQSATGRQVRAVTAEGSYVGFVLYTSDSLVVMAPEVHPRDPRLPDAYALPLASIIALNRTYAYRWQRWGPLLGAGVGATLGAALTGSDDQVPGGSFGALFGFTIGDVASRLSGGGRIAAGPEALNALAYFDDTRPPELPPPSVAASLADRPRPRPVPLPPPPRLHEWVSLGIHGAVSTTEPELSSTGVTVATSVTPVQFARTIVGTRREPLSVPFRVDLSVRPIRWVRIGAYVGRSTSGDSLAGNTGVEQVLRSYGPIRPYAEVALPVIRVGRQRLEMAAGGGLERYHIRAVQIAPPYQQQGPFERPITPATLEVSDAGTAWFFHVGAELYASPHTSLFVRHSWHPLPALEIGPFANRYALRPDILLRLVDAHSVDFTYREVTIGSRVHF